MVSWDDKAKRSLFGGSYRSRERQGLPPTREDDGQQLLFGTPSRSKPSIVRKKPKREPKRKPVRHVHVGTEADNVWRVCSDCSTPLECAEPPRTCKVFGF